jgi:hypothetical protein
MRDKSIDLNSLLIGANLVVAALIMLASSWTEGNPYIDQDTIVLGVLLCVQTHAALVLERRRRDPFIVLLAVEMIVYYSLRIFTLTLYPFSLVFDRYPYGTADSNYALVFIIISNVFLYAGSYLAGSRRDQALNAVNWKATAPSRVGFLIVVAIGVSYFSENHAPGESVPRVVGFLELFVSANIIILMALAYYFLFRKSLGKGFAVMLGLLILVDMVVHTLTGSRSAIVAFVQDCVLVGLAMMGCIRLRRAYVLGGLFLLPLLVVLLVGSFIISTYNRTSREIGASFDLGRAFNMAQQGSSDLWIKESLDATLPLILARVGFFDFSAEIIAHRAQYRSVINLPVYGESIVDNILTPGFDVYDMPKVANALQFIYMDWGTPSKQDVAESYQSDQIGIYGEFYALFGYASLPLMFLTPYLFKELYVRATSANPFFLLLKRVVILYLFVEVIRSFGIDWVLAETVPIVVAIFAYTYFFSTRPMSATRTVAPFSAGML